MLSIRDANESDLPAILALTNREILHGTALWTIQPASLAERRAWMESRRAAGFPVIVADNGGSFCGYASYGPFRPHDGYRLTVEHSLYVASYAQGRGIGKQLLGELVSRAERAGAHAMIGGVEAGNAISLALHDAMGFTEVGRLPQVGRKFDRWLDLVLMQRILEPA